MAIEHRAIFALSIAFTASIVAFPDLPPDIPPRAGFDGPFVGAPFVAFFLPIAAIAMWWIVDNASGRPARGAAQQTSSAGAATALFLSAFHVTMLIAFIGGQPWLGRVLGAMVGAFLIATGNALPRVRPNLTWGIRTQHTLQNEDLWRRVHRLTGYIRVITGLAICVTALAGLPLADATDRRGGDPGDCGRRGGRRPAVAAPQPGGRRGALSPGRDGGTGAGHPGGSHRDAAGADRRHGAEAAGAAAHRRHGGRRRPRRPCAAARAATAGRRLNPDVPVDPERTLFRVGSVTKVLTAVAALGLVDDGKADLHQDIRAYLPDVPMRYGATLHQLLTHTAALRRAVRRCVHRRRSPDAPGRASAPQSARPGDAARAGLQLLQLQHALAGLVIEARSGMTFERYLDDRVFGPIEDDVEHGASAAPAGAGAGASRAAIDGPAIATSRWTTATSTRARPGALSTTAGDMGRFMLALLGDGSVDGGTVLTPASTTALLAAQFTPDPRIPAAAYGFVPPDVAWAPAGLSRRHARRSARLADPRARGSPGHLRRLELAAGPRRLSLRADDDAPLRRRRPAAARAGAEARRARSRRALCRRLSRLPPHPQ